MNCKKILTIKKPTMNLTEPQIEAVFEWIDLNVDRKTAIRFVKDFYKPHEVNAPFCQTAKSKTIVDKNQGEFTSTNTLPDWMCPKATDKPWDPVTDLNIWNIKYGHEAEKILEYKCGTTIESYSHPGQTLRIGPTPILVGDKLIAPLCLNLSKNMDYVRDTVLMERNFNGTGNTYWATIVKDEK